MITFPSKYSVGFNNHSPSMYFIDIECLNLGVRNHLYTSNIDANFTYGGGGVTSQTKYLAAKIINSDGQEQSVDGLGEIDQQVDPSSGGVQAGINTATITLLSQGSFIATNNYDFIGQPIKIYRTFAPAGSSVTIETDAVKIFDGVMTDYSYDSTQFTLQCADRRAIDIGCMPNFYLTNDKTAFPNVDRNAAGKFVPTLIGDMSSSNNYNATLYNGLPPWYFGKMVGAPTMITDIYRSIAYASDSISSLDTKSPIFITGDSTQFVAIVSSSFTYVPATGVGTLSGVNAFIPSSSDFGTQDIFGECFIIPSAQGWDSLSKEPESTRWATGVTDEPDAYYYVLHNYVYPVSGQTSNPIVNFQNAVDNDPNTYLDILNTGSAFLYVKLPDFSSPGTMINANDFGYCYGDPVVQTYDFYVGLQYEWIDGGAPSDFQFTIVDSIAGSGGISGANNRYQVPIPNTNGGTGLESGAGIHNTEFPIKAYNIWEYTGVGGNAELQHMTWDLFKSRVRFGIFSTGSGAKTLRLHHMWVRAKTRFENQGILKKYVNVPQYSPFYVNPVFGQHNQDLLIRGPEHIVNWNTEVRGQGISNLFLPAKGPVFTSAMTRGNGNTTSTIIQDPASAVEWLLRYKLNVATANIDTDSFDTLNNTSTGLRKDWKFAASLIERKPVLDYVSQICQEYHMSLLMTQAGQYRLVAHDIGSVAYTITGSDVYFNGYPQISVAETDNSIIQNDLMLNWGYDYTTSKTLKQTYISDINFDGAIEDNLVDDSGALRGGGSYGGWFADSVSRYGARKQLGITSQFCQDAATADLMIKRWADWLAFRRLIVTAQLVPNLHTTALEVGDQVLIHHDVLTPLFNNTAQFIITSKTIPAVSNTQDPYITITALELPSSNTGIPIVTRQFISDEDLSV